MKEVFDFDGRYVPFNVRSYSQDGIVTTSYSDDYIIRGKSFQIARIFNLSTGVTKFVFDCSDVDDSKRVFVLPLRFGADDGPMQIKTYQATYSGGSSIPPINLNTLSDTTSQVSILNDVTSSDSPGDDLREYLIGSSGGIFTAGRGGQIDGEGSVILDNTAVFLIDVDNQSGGDANFRLGIVWFEIESDGSI